MIIMIITIIIIIIIIIIINNNNNNNNNIIIINNNTNNNNNKIKIDSLQCNRPDVRFDRGAGLSNQIKLKLFYLFQNQPN